MSIVHRAIIDARAGVVDLREARELAEAELASARQALADAHFELAAATHEAQRASWPRHLQATETTGPRRALRCGEGPAPSTGGAATRSLDLYLPRGSRRG